MITLRIRLLFSLTAFTSLLYAQQPSEEVKQETQLLATMLRSQPPEATMHRIDSLLAIPAAEQDPLLRMWIHNYRGHAFRLLGKHDEAMSAQVRAYQLADSLNDIQGKVESLIAIGIIHMDLKELEAARRELLKVYDLTEAFPAAKDYRVPLILGAIALKGGNMGTALTWYEKALPLAEASGDSLTICDVRYNLGVAYKEKPDLEASERYLLAALAAIPHDGYGQLEARAREVLAAVHIEQERLDEVQPLLDRAHELSIAIGAGDALQGVLMTKKRYLLARGDTAGALQTSERLLEVKDSLSTVYHEETLAEVQASFNVARMEKELELTKAEAEVNKLRAQRSWIAWGALAVIGVLAIVLIVLSRRQYLLKKQAAVVLEQDKERLLEENEMLHQENLMARFETLKSQIDPHFLFNAMNTLYTLVETEPKKAREFVSSFSALYRKVLTSRERTIVPVQEELELVHHYLFLQRIRFGESLQVNVEIPAHALTGYLPPFTIQMLLENAIKHNVISASHPLHITITVEGEHLIVRNDLMVRGTKEAGTGTGLENIKRRYVMLGAAEPTFTVSDTHYTASVPILSQES